MSQSNLFLCLEKEKSILTNLSGYASVAFQDTSGAARTLQVLGRFIKKSVSHYSKSILYVFSCTIMKNHVAIDNDFFK